MLDKLVVFMLSLRAKLSSERGQDIMEYAILSGGIAVALLAALAIWTATGGPLDGFFTRLGDFMDGLVP